jgi:hypothetical protein
VARGACVARRRSPSGLSGDARGGHRFCAKSQRPSTRSGGRRETRTEVRQLPDAGPAAACGAVSRVAKPRRVPEERVLPPAGTRSSLDWGGLPDSASGRDPLRTRRPCRAPASIARPFPAQALGRSRSAGLIYPLEPGMPRSRSCGRRTRAHPAGSRTARHALTCGSLLSSDLAVEGECEPKTGRRPQRAPSPLISSGTHDCLDHSVTVHSKPLVAPDRRRRRGGGCASWVRWSATSPDRMP